MSMMNDPKLPTPHGADVDWQAHEHVTAPVLSTAQKLVEETGSPQLAKQAIDAAQNPSSAATTPGDGLAQRLGFVSYLDLFEASEPVLSSDHRRWFVTIVKGQWTAWNDVEFQAQPFSASREIAIQQMGKGMTGTTAGDTACEKRGAAPSFAVPFDTATPPGASAPAEMPDAAAEASSAQHQQFTPLAKLEKALMTPILSGELARWTNDVQQAFREALSALERHWKTMHESQFSEILRQDPELATHVDHLREEDQAVVAEFQKLALQAQQFPAQAAAAGGDEAKLRTPLTRFTDQALALLLRVRKQETALQTWFVEAFKRDTGTID